MSNLQALTSIIQKGKVHNRTTHGMTGTRPYKIWCGMMRRCYNKNDISYLRYGGKGVIISENWKKFDNFWRDMESTYFDKATIDRINNKKGYSKSNCRWATIIEQARNKKSVKRYNFKGKVLTRPEIEQKLGLKKNALRNRLENLGWSVEKSLKTPKTSYKGYFIDSRGKYRVEVKKDGKRHFVGRYDTEKQALKARNNFLLELLK